MPSCLRLVFPLASPAFHRSFYLPTGLSVEFLEIIQTRDYLGIAAAESLLLDFQRAPVKIFALVLIDQAEIIQRLSDIRMIITRSSLATSRALFASTIA
jgi:hypothetical protein